MTAPVDAIAGAEKVEGTNTWNDPALVDGAAACVEMIQNGWWPEDMVGIAYQDSVDSFSAGNALMHVNGTFAASSFDGSDSEIRFLPFPARSESVPMSAPGGLGSTWSVAADTDNVEAALDFVEFVAFSPEANVASIELMSDIAANPQFDPAMADVSDLQKQAIAAVNAVSGAGGVGYWMCFESTPAYITACNDQLQLLLNQRITPEEFGQNLTDAMNEARSE